MNNEITVLAKAYANARAFKDELEAQLKEASEVKSAAEQELIAALTDAGMSGATVDGVGKISLVEKEMPSVNAGNKPQFYDYLRASGNEGILRLDVPAPTLSKFIKDHSAEIAQRLQHEGLTVEEVVILQSVDRAKYAKLWEKNPLDEYDSKEMAKEILKSHGASMFSKLSISVRAK